MPTTRKTLRNRLLLFLAVIGPGLIAGEGGNDAGGIWT
jgi:Mn2+/Fe2+ NRAMP family transporter